MNRSTKHYHYQNLSLEDLEGELWEDIPALEGYYCVSNYGRTKRLPHEILCNNGQYRKMKEKILKPELTIQENHSVNDLVYYLRVKMMVSGVVYNYSVARLVYYLFVKEFDLLDLSFVVIAKDGDGKHILPDNLVLVDLSGKQQRIFERNRYVKELPDAYEEYVDQGLIKSTNPFCKQITQYSLEGKKIQTFPSTKVAAQILGVSETGINSVLKGRQVSSAGYVWRYNIERKVDVEAVREERKQNFKQLVGQKVTQYDREGKGIATYLTISDAAQAVGIGSGDISNVLSGKQKSAGGFIWKKGWGKPQIDLSNYAFGEQLRAQRKHKKIKQYSPEGKYLQTHNSVKEAAKALGISPSYISMVLDKEKLAKGFVWKSANE